MKFMNSPVILTDCIVNKKLYEVLSDTLPVPEVNLPLH